MLRHLQDVDSDVSDNPDENDVLGGYDIQKSIKTTTDPNKIDFYGRVSGQLKIHVYHRNKT